MAVAGDIGGHADLLDCRNGLHVLITRSQNWGGAQGSRPIGETVPDSPGDLVGGSRADVRRRLTVTAQDIECARVSVHRWCEPSSSTEGDNDTGEDFPNHWPDSGSMPAMVPR